jgi:hypothetical protein
MKPTWRFGLAMTTDRLGIGFQQREVALDRAGQTVAQSMSVLLLWSTARNGPSCVMMMFPGSNSLHSFQSQVLNVLRASQVFIRRMHKFRMSRSRSFFRQHYIRDTEWLSW